MLSSKADPLTVVTRHRMKTNKPPQTATFANDFAGWCKAELFTDEFIEAATILQSACDLHCLGLYRSLELERLLAAPRTAAEVTAALRFVDSADIAIEAVLSRLANRTGVVAVNGHGGSPRYQAAAPARDPSDELTAARKRMAEIGAQYVAALEFLDFGAANYVRALRDDPDFMDRILSGRDKEHAELWFRATNTDPLQDVHGMMAARCVEGLFAGGVILEIGGGTGNATRHILRMLAEKNALDRITEYKFTDISMRFLLESRHEFEKGFPSVRFSWRHLDINVPITKQKVEPESVDAIVGVNSAHVAKDIVAFLKECRSTLRPGGKIIFAERIRLNPTEMAPRELALNLSIYHRTAAIRNPDYRPVHCYLHPSHWRRALEIAGFGKVDIFPNLDEVGAYFPDQYAAVVVAER